MWNLDTTKTSNVCLASMSDDEFTDWIRMRLSGFLNDAYESGYMPEYRYTLIASDLLEAGFDELMTLIEEIRYGFRESRVNKMLERLNRGAEMIQNEQDAEKKRKLESHYWKIHSELKEMNEAWTWQTKY